MILHILGVVAVVAALLLIIGFSIVGSAGVDDRR